MLSSFSTYFPQVLNQKGSHLQNDSLDFQNSIKQGNFNLVRDLVARGLSVNEPLPNGEMPLHFSVRSSHQEIVKLLLKSGADPEAKDFQHLSAIDHAVLMKSETILASILGDRIGKEIKEIKEQIKWNGSISHITQLKNKIQKSLVVDVEKLPPLHRAAYKGDLDEISKEVSTQVVDQVDANGLSPIHYAILGNQKIVVDKLIKLNSNIHMIQKDGNSLLHFAAMSKSSQILKILLSLGVNPNHKNSAGATPLHYAAAKENLDFIQILAKGRADLRLVDHQGISPLVVFTTSAFQRDPLSLPKAQISLFIATSVFWVSRMTMNSMFSSKESIYFLIYTLIAASAAEWSQFSVLMSHLTTTWKREIASMGMILGFSIIPPFSIGFQLWETYHVASSAFKGLKHCWQNVGYRNWAVARNITLYSLNTGSSLNNLRLKVNFAYKLFKADFNFYKAYFNFYKGHSNSYKGSFKFEAGLSYPETKVTPSALSELSHPDRILHPQLNPLDTEDALLMMSPNFTMEDLKQKGEPLYKRTYRAVMLTLHPDKTQNANDTAAAIRLNQAKDTLKTWSKNYRT